MTRTTQSHPYGVLNQQLQLNLAEISRHLGVTFQRVVDLQCLLANNPTWMLPTQAADMQSVWEAISAATRMADASAGAAARVGDVVDDMLHAVADEGIYVPQERLFPEDSE